MTTPIMPSITDEQLAEIERFLDFGGSMLKTKSEAWRGVIARLRAAEKDVKRLDFMVADPCVMECQNGSMSTYVFRLYWPREDEHQDAWYPSEREAIDAAIEAQS